MSATKNKATTQARCDQTHSCVLDVMFRIASVPALPAEQQEQEMQDIQQLINEMSFQAADNWQLAQMESSTSSKRPRLDQPDNPVETSSPPTSQDVGTFASVCSSMHMDSPCEHDQDASAANEFDWTQLADRFMASDAED